MKIYSLGGPASLFEFSHHAVWTGTVSLVLASFGISALQATLVVLHNCAPMTIGN